MGTGDGELRFVHMAIIMDDRLCRIEAEQREKGQRNIYPRNATIFKSQEKTLSKKTVIIYKQNKVPKIILKN